ncbi:MAG: HDOD domain-containing protein [Gammaproteobacteria bacterium]
MLTPFHTDLTVSDLLTGDIELASPLVIYVELNKIFADETKSMADVGKVIEKDPGLSARLLKIVNSAFYGFPCQISTITRAITLIGVRELQNLILTTLIIDKFCKLPGGMLSMKEFWSVSLRCGLIAKELAQHRNIAEAAESIFICGLLHDMGLLVLYRRIPELARQAGLMAEFRGIEDIRAEKEVIGFDRYQVGSELARHWKLPEIITQTINNHSQTQLPQKYPLESAIVKLACEISKSTAFPFGFAQSKEWRLLRLSNGVVETAIAEANGQFEITYQTFFPRNGKSFTSV